MLESVLCNQKISSLLYHQTHFYKQKKKSSISHVHVIFVRCCHHWWGFKPFNCVCSSATTYNSSVLNEPTLWLTMTQNLNSLETFANILHSPPFFAKFLTFKVAVDFLSRLKSIKMSHTKDLFSKSPNSYFLYSFLSNLICGVNLNKMRINFPNTINTNSW